MLMMYVLDIREKYLMCKQFVSFHKFWNVLDRKDVYGDVRPQKEKKNTSRI